MDPFFSGFPNFFILKDFKARAQSTIPHNSCFPEVERFRVTFFLRKPNLQFRTRLSLTFVTNQYHQRLSEFFGLE